MSLTLQEWEIWHTYTTYLDSGLIDLDLAAQSLVREGIAQVALINDGTTFWQTKNGVGRGRTRLIRKPSKTFELSTATEAGEMPKGFAMEAWGQGCLFLHAELDVLGEARSLDEPYLRAFLGKCVASGLDDNGNKTSSVGLYPVLLIYQSGVMILELRMIGPSVPVTLDDFIENGVNLFRERFESVEVSPSIASNATAAYYQSQPRTFFQRCGIAWLQARHNLAVEQRTSVSEGDDFSFALCAWSGGPNDLRDIAMTLFHTAAFIILKPRLGISFILLGQKKTPNLGAFWSGRPHVHLIRFDEQQQTATANETRHRLAFNSILSRTPSLAETKIKTMPKDSRMFEDYSAYIGPAVSLWIWSQKGLIQQEAHRDVNRGNFVYERQLLIEVLEHGYMIHRALYHSAEQIRTAAQAITVQKQLLRLRLAMREASQSGEIRELLEDGWGQFGLPALADEISRILALKEAELRSVDTNRATRVGWVIAIVFGFVAVPSLAEQLILPAWNKLQFHWITDLAEAKLIADGIALFAVSVFLCLALLFTSTRRSS